jgi:DNA-directed RNA polymerase specialized sigma24 family protein
MFAIGGYKHREIAEILGLPLGTVTWKYKNAIEKIRNEIEVREKNAKKKLEESY